MKKVSAFFAGFALAGILILSASANDQLELPTVDYSADTVMEAEGMTIKGKVYWSAQKERREMGQGMALLVRRDLKKAWQVMPGGMYTEIALGKVMEQDPSQYKITEKTKVGEETLNGVRTTKYKILAVSPTGDKFGGFFWITAQNINVKSDMLLKDGEGKKRVLLELSNLKIGKVDPKLFELPKGASKLDVNQMMNQFKGAF